MNKLAGIFLAAIAFAAIAPAATAADEAKPATARQATEAWTKEGLQPVQVAGMDLVYVRATARLKGYTKVLLKPASVAFVRDWAKRSSTRVKLSSENSQLLADQMMAMVREEAEKALTEGGYALVDAPGADVLEVDPAIVDLYFAATEGTASRGMETYSASVGNATLVVDLRDSTSGDLVLHALDREIGPASSFIGQKAAAEGQAWARQSIATWALALRKGLDLVNGVKAQP